MIAKRTSKNQLTLPRDVVREFAGTKYFDVSSEHGKIVLAPVRFARADAVRSKLSELGITEADVADAVTWARERP